MSVALLVVMIVLLRLVVDVIVFVSEQNTRIGNALNITLPTCEHGHGCASGRLHGCGLRCAQSHGCKAGNAFKFQFMTRDGIHLANIFLAYR